MSSPGLGTPAFAIPDPAPFVSVAVPFRELSEQGFDPPAVFRDEKGMIQDLTFTRREFPFETI